MLKGKKVKVIETGKIGKAVQIGVNGLVLVSFADVDFFGRTVYRQDELEVVECSSIKVECLKTYKDQLEAGKVYEAVSSIYDDYYEVKEVPGMRFLKSMFKEVA